MQVSVPGMNQKPAPYREQILTYSTALALTGRSAACAPDIATRAAAEPRTRLLTIFMLNLQVALSGKVPDPLGVTPEGWSPSPSDPSLSHFAPSDTPAEREGLKRMTSTGRLRDAPLRRVITITEGPCTRNKGTAWKSWCRRVFGRVLHKWHEADTELSAQVFVYPEDSGQLARRAAIAVCSAARCAFRSEHRAIIESSHRFSGETHADRTVSRAALPAK